MELTCHWGHPVSNAAINSANELWVSYARQYCSLQLGWLHYSWDLIEMPEPQRRSCWGFIEDQHQEAQWIIQAQVSAMILQIHKKSEQMTKLKTYNKQRISVFYSIILKGLYHPFVSSNNKMCLSSRFIVVQVKAGWAVQSLWHLSQVSDIWVIAVEKLLIPVQTQKQLHTCVTFYIICLGEQNCYFDIMWVSWFN